MFINASAEFTVADSAPRRLAAEHKQEIVRYMREHCEATGMDDPGEVSEQLNILLEGAIVTARVVGQVTGGGTDPGAAARRAKAMAVRIVDQV